MEGSQWLKRVMTHQCLYCTGRFIFRQPSLFFSLAHLQGVSCHYLKYARLFSSQGLCSRCNCAWHGQRLFSIQVSVCRFHSKPFLDYLSAHSTFYNVILILILFFACLISNAFLICWCILSLLSLNFILCANRDLVSCSALPVLTHSFGQYLLFIGHL